MDKALLGVVVGAVIMITSLLSANVVGEDAFTFVDYEDELDVYPGSQSWNEFGTFDGTTNDSENQLITANGNGSYFSDPFIFNTSLDMSQLIVESDGISSNDNAVMFVEYLNDDAVPVYTQNFTLTEDLNTFALEDIDTQYNGYSYQISIEDGSSGDVEIERLVFEYEREVDLTEELPINLTEFITVIPFLLGFMIFFLSFIMLAVVGG